MNFNVFHGHEYLNLKTFRKSGEAILTPVWFAQVGDTLFITTEPQAGKVKRMRNNGSVEIAACDQVGNLLGDWQPAQAQVLTDEAQCQRAHELLFAKYSASEMMQNLANVPLMARAFIQVVPVGASLLK
ncbi:MAG: PPOX class F420-dependent oxidoreductase [Armatimonadetes bacterium]|nr:PPOX class F420-dependent oxidoreductase [Anaerolineae bacterium]